MKLAVLIAALVSCIAPAPAQDPLRKKVDAIYEAGGYERDLPGREPPDARLEGSRGSDRPADPGSGSGGSGEIVPPSSPPTDIRGPFESFVSILPWAAVAAILAILVVSHLRSLPPGRKAARPSAKTADVVTATAPEPEPPRIAEARALAAQGRFAEAIHLLLLEAIRRVKAGTTRVLGASLTSREVLAAAKVGPEGRDALGRLVRAVEVSRFGGRPAALADFESCAAELNRIAT